MTHRPRSLVLEIGLALGLWLGSGTVHAFKEPGHRAIEAAAYDRLLSDPDGRKAIVKLIQYGVLEPPKSPALSPASRLYGDFAAYNLSGLSLTSHLPDHLLDRQLQQDLQCFHFNARGSHVTRVEGQMYGMPKGLVVDAYLECLGVADSLLRSVLYAPADSNRKSVGMYVLLHLIEDSFADSHVARLVPRDYEGQLDDPEFLNKSVATGQMTPPTNAASPVESPADDQAWKIVYVKPWSLRTWWSYFVVSPFDANDTARLHFSEHQHQTFVEDRDWGYVLGDSDDQAQQCPTDAYRARMSKCEADAQRLLGVDIDSNLSALESEMVVPPSCLSRRAQRASLAVEALIRLVANYVDKTKPGVVEGQARGVRQLGSHEGVSFAQAWLEYRTKHLGHVQHAYTENMSEFQSASPWVAPSKEDSAWLKDERAGVNYNLVYPAEGLIPKNHHTGGFGLSTEFVPSTPLWLTFDAFLAHTSVLHDTMSPLDMLSYGLQLRLPMEDELGERPVGIALEPGITLPVPLSDLIGNHNTPFALYLGLRGRVAYTVTSVFEDQARHVLSWGFGGVSLDAIIGDYVWLGVDLPRVQWGYDFWERQPRERTTTWSVSGGIATHVF